MEVCAICETELRLDKFDGTLQCPNQKCSQFPVGFYPRRKTKVKSGDTDGK